MQTWGHGRFVSFNQRGSDPDGLLEAPSSALSREMWNALSVGSVEDQLFSDQTDTEQALGMVLDRLLDRLPEQQRDCLSLVVVSGMTYGQAAKELGWRLPSGDFDRKKVSRNVQAGAKQLRRWLSGAPWIDTLLRGRVRQLDG